MSVLQVWCFTTGPPITATPSPSPTPRGCAWRTRRSSQHQASCRPPSLMDTTTATPAGCLTRLYSEFFNWAQLRGSSLLSLVTIVMRCLQHLQHCLIPFIGLDHECLVYRLVTSPRSWYSFCVSAVTHSCHL